MAFVAHNSERFSKERSAPSCVASIAVFLLLVSLPQSRAAALAQGSHSNGLPLSPRPASMGLSAAPNAVQAQAAPSPSYDEQLGSTFTQDFSSLAFNVTAVAQADADGYGPGYLLNGLTTAGYWYQVGVSYHWPNSDGSYDPGFGFSYEVYGSDGKSVYPSKGAGLGSFSGPVNSGDSVLLSLTFMGSSVLMKAQDWETGATAEASYSSVQASTFMGDTVSPVNSNGFFTGLMTEWYHAAAYYGNEQQVTYSDDADTLAAAWMWIDEFESGSNAPTLFNNGTPSPVIILGNQVYPFTADGASMYISAHDYVTGVSSSSSTLTLTPYTPATQGGSSPSFSASYTLSGQPQTTNIASGTTVLDADPGTMITVSISEPDPTQGSWAFSNGASPSEVTFAAGTNATYVYYALVQETISYQVAGGGQALPASSEPELRYQEPPQAASATPSAVTATLMVGTTSTTIDAIRGSAASINAGTIPGGPGERWATNTQNWTFTAPDMIPGRIQYYQQYNVSASYSIVGGGTPSEIPSFNSTAFGVPLVVPLSDNSTAGWFDAGSGYSFTSVLNGSTSTERWWWIGTGNSSNLSSPNERLVPVYDHQFYVTLGVNDKSGGNLTVAYPDAPIVDAGVGSIWSWFLWIDTGGILNAGASANQGWQFESWNSSGTDAYSGTNPSFSLTVSGPLSENATFYPGLAIVVDSGTNVVYSYGSTTGTVGAGTTKTLYVPPSSNVTLRATPSLFVYSFASLQGTGLAKATKPSLALVVDSPSTVTGTSSYNYAVVLGAAIVAAIVIILAVSLLVLSRRRREQISGFDPSYPPAATPSGAA